MEKKNNLLDVTITESFIAGRLTGKIEAFQELLDLSINDSNIRRSIEIKLEANKEALRILQEPLKM